MLQLGYPPNRIDLLSSPDGVIFAECYPLKNEVEIDGQTIAFIDIEDLIKNKRASGRLQDMADVEKLTEST